MNLPNKITVLRVFLVPVFVVFFLIPAIPYGKYFAAAIFVIACLTDALDGYLARKWNLVTNFGKFMDPLADKLLVCSAILCFVELQRIPAWIAIIIIGREFIISGFRLVASDAGIVIAAANLGKFKTAAQMIMSVLLILHFEWAPFPMIEQIFIYVSLILTVVSLVDYLYKNMHVLKKGGL